jgi:hypothetical protein
MIQNIAHEGPQNGSWSEDDNLADKRRFRLAFCDILDLDGLDVHFPEVTLHEKKIKKLVDSVSL